MLNVLPMEPTDELFGQPVGKRRLWSVRSAAIATGAHPKRLRKLLVAGGLIGSDCADQTDDRVIFPTDQAAEEFLGKVAGAMPLNEAGRYINAPRVQLRILFDGGFIRPFVTGATDVILDHAFAKQDLDDFLARLLVDSTDATAADTGLADIPTAARKARCSAADIVRLLLDRRLSRVRRRQDALGYMSVLVDPDEVRPLVFKETRDGLSIREAVARTHWSEPVLLALIDNGFLPSHVVQNPISHLSQRIVRPEDLETFMATYVSLHNLAKERGIHHLRLKTEIEAAGVRPAFSREAVPATFYRRKETWTDRKFPKNSFQFEGDTGNFPHG